MDESRSMSLSCHRNKLAPFSVETSSVNVPTPDWKKLVAPCLEAALAHFAYRAIKKPSL